MLHSLYSCFTRYISIQMRDTARHKSHSSWWGRHDFQIPWWSKGPWVKKEFVDQSNAYPIFHHGDFISPSCCWETMRYKYYRLCPFTWWCPRYLLYGIKNLILCMCVECRCLSERLKAIKIQCRGTYRFIKKEHVDAWFIRSHESTSECYPLPLPKELLSFDPGQWRVTLTSPPDRPCRCAVSP